MLRIKRRGVSRYAGIGIFAVLVGFVGMYGVLTSNDRSDWQNGNGEVLSAEDERQDDQGRSDTNTSEESPAARSAESGESSGVTPPLGQPVPSPAADSGGTASPAPTRSASSQATSPAPTGSPSSSAPTEPSTAPDGSAPQPTQDESTGSGDDGCIPLDPCDALNGVKEGVNEVTGTVEETVNEPSLPLR